MDFVKVFIYFSAVFLLVWLGRESSLFSMTFLKPVYCVVAVFSLYLLSQSIDSILTSVKIPFVVKNINHISTVDSEEVIRNLNKFLNKEFEITYSETANVKFILSAFDSSVKEMFFTNVCGFREALVSKEKYFDLALINFLLCYDEEATMGENTLSKKRATCHDTKYHDGLSSATTEYDITKFGITFYKMLAAMSKKCNGKKSLYLLCSVNEHGNPVGKRHYVRYDFDHDSVFQKLRTKEYTVTYYER